MDKVTDNYLNCPICMELPENEVYQCRNGHPICKSCCEGVSTCPQCRVEFETPKIRLRVLESILDSIELKCVYHKEGCKTELLRNDLKKHTQICQFRPIEFCKLVGFPTCTFFNFNPLSIFHHLFDVHNVEKLLGGNCTTTVAKHFGAFTSNSDNDGVYVKLWDAQVDKSPLYFVICMVISVKKSECSFVCIQMDGDCSSKPSKYSVTFHILNSSNQKSVLTWTTAPGTNHETCTLLQYPPMKISLPYLVHHLGGGKQDYTLLLKVSVSER